ncbi:MAG TPA: multiheme c-type cytochrome, partial [Pseudomonadales bacterium]
MRRPLSTSLFALLLLTLFPLAGCEPDTPAPGSPALPLAAAAAAAEYAGSEACAACHAAAYADWQGSHHDLALQAANGQSVLGLFPTRFGDTVFEAAGDRFQITPAGSPEPRPVLYTFGVTPLQQYVIPAANGALQTFPIAWDSRPEAAGGQRWYALYEGDFGPDDPMHWTGRANRWNSQCADCHSTGVRKHYDPASRSYQTTWAVDDVGCEACHGPGSRHIADPGGSPVELLTTQADEINACAPCHARRTQIAEGFIPDAPLLDFYRPQFIVPGLYHTDGQIDDEVYVYGSFLQSRMHLAGVSCSDCHQPHRAALRRPGNETCTLCHQSTPGNRFAGQAAGNYDTPEH